MTTLPAWVAKGTVLGVNYTLKGDQEVAFPVGSSLFFVPAMTPPIVRNSTTKETVWLSPIKAAIGADGNPKVINTAGVLTADAPVLAAGQYNVTIEIGSKPISFGMTITAGNNYLTDQLSIIVPDGSGQSMALADVIAGVDAVLAQRYVPMPTTAAVGVLSRAGDGTLSWQPGGSGVADVNY